MEGGNAICHVQKHPEMNCLKMVGFLILEDSIKNTLDSPFLSLIKFLQIAEGLEYLHTRDPFVVHGDVRGVSEISIFFGVI